MDISIFLAKFIGIFLIVMGLFIVTRQKALNKMVDDYIKNETITFVAAMINLILGLLVVLSHNVWDSTWQALITVIGWLMLLKAVIYLFLPHKELKSLWKGFHNGSWYFVSAILSLLLGFYLTFIGFSA